MSRVPVTAILGVDVCSAGSFKCYSTILRRGSVKVE